MHSKLMFDETDVCLSHTMSFAPHLHGILASPDTCCTEGVELFGASQSYYSPACR